MASGKGFSLNKIWKVLESIDRAKDAEVEKTLRKWGVPKNVRRVVRGTTGGVGSLINAIGDNKEDYNDNTRPKQVQGRTSKYKGHYHTVYGQNNVRNKSDGVERKSYKGYKYSGKYNKRKY